MAPLPATGFEESNADFRLPSSTEDSAWYKDYEQLIRLLNPYITEFVMSPTVLRITNDLDRMRWSQCHTKIDATEELIKFIIFGSHDLLRDALIAFIRKKPGLSSVLAETSTTPGLPPLPRQVALLPPTEHCYGRLEERQLLAEMVVAPDVRSAIIYGGPGMGKTVLALDALCSGPAKETYDLRRYFIRCNGLNRPVSIVHALIRHIGIVGKTKRSPLIAVTSFLDAAPALVVIDNLETLWDQRPHRANVERILRQLGTVAHLIITVRGQIKPDLGDVPVLSIEARRMDHPTARDLFLHFAPSKANDAALDELLRYLDYLPLAIKLIARQVHAATPLEDVKNNLDVLAVGLGDTKDLSLMVSVELSLKSPAISDPTFPQAKQLLAMVAAVPDGLALSALRRIMVDDEYKATSALCDVGIAFRSSHGRLRILQPIKETLQKNLGLVPQQPYLSRTLRYFLQIATQGEQIGGDRGSRVIEDLRAEFVNVEWSLKMYLEHFNLDKLFLEALSGFAKFQRCSGIGSTFLLESAALKFDSDERFSTVAAHVKLELAGVLLSRSDFAGTRIAALSALRHFRKSQDPNDNMYQGRCLNVLATMNGYEGRLEEARKFAEAALRCLEQCNDDESGGSVDALYMLGFLENKRQRYQKALRHFNQALEGATKHSNFYIMATCHHGIATTYRKTGNVRHSLERLQKAIECYDKSGEVSSRTYALRDHGIVLYLLEHFNEARRVLQESQRAFEVIGNTRGRATSFRELAKCSMSMNQFIQAAEEFTTASILFQECDATSEVDQCRLEAKRCRNHSPTTKTTSPIPIPIPSSSSSSGSGSGGRPPSLFSTMSHSLPITSPHWQNSTSPLALSSTCSSPNRRPLTPGFNSSFNSPSSSPRSF